MEGIKFNSNGAGPMQKLMQDHINGLANKPVAEVEDAAEAPRHTEDMQDIISKVPSWILRWGITAFFGVLVMVVGISVLIRYPDVVKVPMRLETLADAATVFSAAPGKIAKVLVNQGQAVKKGQVLVGIANENAPLSLTPVTATCDGEVRFVGIVQPGYPVKANQQLFVIHPVDEQFFGVAQIAQNDIAKIKEGQQVLIGLHNAADDRKLLKGTINYIADEPLKNGLFLVQVSLNKPANANADKPQLQTWMTADAEIITQDATLFSRITRNMFKGIR